MNAHTQQPGFQPQFNTGQPYRHQQPQPQRPCCRANGDCGGITPGTLCFATPDDIGCGSKVGAARKHTCVVSFAKAPARRGWMACNLDGLSCVWRPVWPAAS